MALERDPPYLADTGDETETWKERERRREKKLERAFEAQRERDPLALMDRLAGPPAYSHEGGDLSPCFRQTRWKDPASCLSNFDPTRTNHP